MRPGKIEFMSAEDCPYWVLCAGRLLRGEASCRAVGPERFSQSFGQELGFGNGREVAAAGMLGPAGDAEVPLAQVPGWLLERGELAAEDVNRGRGRRGISRWKCAPRRMPVGPVGQQGRRGGPGSPIKGEGGQQVVPAERRTPVGGGAGPPGGLLP